VAGVLHDGYQPTQGSARISLTSNGVGNRNIRGAVNPRFHGDCNVWVVETQIVLHRFTWERRGKQSKH